MTKAYYIFRGEQESKIEFYTRIANEIQLITNKIVSFWISSDDKKAIIHYEYK